MDFIQAIVLGILQGIFEWLPISSQGQIMALAIAFFSLKPETALQYAVFLHLGTVLAALLYFRKELISLLKLQNKNFGKFLLIALISTPITALPTYLFLKTILASGSLMILLLIGLFLILTGFLQSKRFLPKAAALNEKNAFLLGLAQGLSVLPGISRSGITTAMLLFEGFKPEQAFKISFILSVPSVGLASLFFVFANGFEISTSAMLSLFAAFLAGFASIDFLLKIAKRISFSKFCIGFGLLYILIAIAEGFVYV